MISGQLGTAQLGLAQLGQYEAFPLNRSFSDQIILSDSLNLPGVLTISVGLNDTFVFNDTNGPVINLIGFIKLAISDSVSLSDSTSKAFPIGLNIKDNRAKLALTDSVLKRLSAATSVTDQLNLQDLVQIVLIPIANLILIDQFAFSDSINVVLNSIFTSINLSLSDQLLTGDLNAILRSPDYLQLSDRLLFSDSVILSNLTDLNPYLRRYLNDVIGTPNPVNTTFSQPGSGGGSSGGSGADETFNDNIIPTGPINGSNKIFTLPSAPNPPGSLILLLSGVYQVQGVDYILLNGATISFSTAPTSSSTLIAFYRS